MPDAVHLYTPQVSTLAGAKDSTPNPVSRDMAIAQQSLQAALRGGADGHYADFWYDDSEDSVFNTKRTTYALEAFIWKDADAQSTDGLLTRKEAEETDLTFVDPNDDGYMSASEIDFFGEADKVGRIQKSRVLDELLCDKEARAQGIAFFDDNGDGLMSREEYADVQSGKADVFGAADRAHEKDGAVVDGLINRKEAENQGLIFFDSNGDDLMSRDEFANLQSDSPDLFEAADRAHEKDGAVVDGLINLEESEDQGLIFFDNNGDGLMSLEEFSQVAHHQVGGMPADRCYRFC